jgi:hypothetical protein
MTSCIVTSVDSLLRARPDSRRWRDLTLAI